MRNAFVIITVAMTAALISGLAGVTVGMEKEEERQLDTMQHVVYTNVTDAQIDALRQDERTEEVMAYKMGDAFEENGYRLCAGYFPTDSKTIETAASEISQGRYPQKKNEIAVDKAYMACIGKKPVIGEEIEIAWLDGTAERFVVSGYTDDKTSARDFMVMLSEKYAENGSQLKDVPYSAAVRIRGADEMNSDDFLNEIRSIGEQIGVARHDIVENNRFVTNKSLTFGDIIAVAVVSIAILLASVLVIYSIFYISISDKMRQFGQFRTIGTTSKQIRNMVNMEGVSLGMIGVALGLFIGTGFAYALKPAGFYFPNTLAIWGITAISDLIAVILSIRKPAKLAASVSPVEAAKASSYEEGKISKRRVLTPLGLAKISSDRNRKKSRMTAISLGIGGVLFLCGATILSSFSQEDYSRQLEFHFGEYALHLSSNAEEAAERGITDLQLSNVLNDELKEKIESLPGVKRVTAMEQLGVTYEYNHYRADDSATPFDREEMALLNRSRESKAAFDYDEMVSEKEIIITNNDTVEEIFGWRFQTGDKILLRWYDGASYREDAFRIAGCVDPTALYNDREASESGKRLEIESGWFLIPRELADDMVSHSHNFYDAFVVSVADWQNDTEVKGFLEAVVDENAALSLGTLKEEMEANETTFLSIQYMVYGLSAFVIGFALLNLTNTLVSSTMARKKEFAMLRSIGMGNGQLRNMIVGEGLILAVKNIVITATFGTAAGCLLIAAAREVGIHYLHWHFPLWYLAGYCMVVVAVPVMIARVMVAILDKRTLVERLREIDIAA